MEIAELTLLKRLVTRLEFPNPLLVFPREIEEALFRERVCTLGKPPATLSLFSQKIDVHTELPAWATFNAA